jgi:Fe-S-cluster containining protein
MDAPTPAWASGGEVRDDLDRSLRFLTTLAMQSKADVFEVAIRLIALLELAVEKGLVDSAALNERVETVRGREGERAAGQLQVKLLAAVDKYTMTDLPNIPCGELIPICLGRCCMLEFPLALQDLEERAVEFDYGRPYMIKQGTHGYCVHSSEETRFCTVYERRPAVCRKYDCRTDPRIWSDFEKRIPAKPPEGVKPFVKLRVPEAARREQEKPA